MELQGVSVGESGVGEGAFEGHADALHYVLGGGVRQGGEGV